MKKLLSLLLALTLLISMFALVSCDNDGDDGDSSGRGLESLNGKSPEEIYEAATAALAEATSFEVVSSQVITMVASYGGETQTMEMTQDVIAKIDGDNSYTKVAGDNMGVNVNMEAWYVDGVVYSNTAGMKLKTNLTKEQYMEQYMNADPSESTLLDIPESWFEDISFEKVDGEYKMNFVIDSDNYNELFGNLGLEGYSIKGDVTYCVYFDADGTLTHIETEFDMEASSMGVSIDAHCVSTSVVNMKQVTVTAPSDADSYQLVANP